MATMDIFNNDAFSMVELTDAFIDGEYLPQYLGQFFTARPVTTEKVAIEKKAKVLSLIPTSERGSPIDEATGQKRNIRDFRTARLAQGDTLNASEISGIRAFGSTTELQAIQTELADRIENIDDNLELSFEKCRLGALQGKMIDPKTDEVIYNWFTEFGVSQPTEIDFDLDNASPAAGALLKVCNTMVRAIITESKGAVTPQTKVIALVGDAFWDDLVTHSHVTSTYANWMAAEALRGDLAKPYGEFKFGNITWVNYRGTDDGSKIAVGDDKAIIFPIGVKGNLVHAMSPSDEHFEYVNTKGKKKYTLLEQDPSTNKKWVRAEVYAYPLFYCARPLTLRRGKRT